MEIDRDEKGSEGNVVKSVKLKTVAGIELCDIPEWLLVEVLIRLPVKLVFRSKLVSKKWLSVISDPYFARMYVSRASMSPQLQPWTFIADYMHVEDSRSWGSLEHELLTDTNSRSFKHPGYFVLPCPCTEHPHGKAYSTVAVSNGLVLYGSRLSEGRLLREFHQYSICNPITGQSITLPPHAPHFDFVSSGFLTRVEINILISYRVVRLGLQSQRSKMIRFYVFNSEIGEWKEFTVCIDQAIQVAWWRPPTAFSGILHWITCNHGMIAYDPYHNPDHLRFIALPGDIELTCNDERYMGAPSLCDVHQGRLRYFESSVGFEHPNGFFGFGVWLLNDYGIGDWSLQHRVSSADILYHDILHSGPNFPVPISFHPFDSSIVYLGYRKTIVSYNIKTRKLDDHGGLLDIGNIVGQTKFVRYETCPIWWLTFLLMIPPWPVYIPPRSFRVAND